MRRCASGLALLVMGGLLAGAAGASSGAAPIASLATAPRYASLASERIYFVMTDRYANGDPSNDRGGSTSTLRSATGFDPADTGYFHGGDLKGLTGNCTDTRSGLARIKALGFNAIWITPPVRNQVVTGNTAGYHGYWGLDFTTVDPHLGTEADFAAFVACAHSLGMKVILDVVVNHTGDIVLLTGSGFVSPSEVPYRDCRGKKFDPAAFVTKTFPCMSAGNMPRVPTIVPEERSAKKPEWMNDPTNYHDRGDIDFNSCNEVCYEHGDFFGLDDLFTEKPVVWQGLAQVYGEWIRKYKLDGFRVDTARHVNAAFFRLWTPRIVAAARAAGIDDFSVFGEVFSTDTQYLASFVRDRGVPTVLDFPLQDALTGFVAGSTNARAIRDRLNDDDYFRTPNGVAPTPPTFLGNHDMGRAAYQVRAHGAPEGQLLARTLLAYDVLYLLRGAPVVYYGDEVGMIGRGGDQQARQDMFPTQVAEWRTQERIGSPPIGDGSSFDVASHPVAQRLVELAKLRDQAQGLARGSSVVRYASGRVLVVSRIDHATREEYVLAFNTGTSAAHVRVATSTPGAPFKQLYGSFVDVTASARGAITFDIPALSSLVFRATGVSSPSPRAPKVTVTGDNLSNLWRVGAAVGARADVSVTFALKRRGGAWRRLAVDDAPPYRAFLDPVKFRRGERVQLAAVARSLAGRTAASNAVTFRVRRR